MKIVIRSLLLAALFLAPWGSLLMAAPPIGDPPPCWPPPCIPIDGGLTALIAAGALLGGRQALRMRQAARKPQQ